MAEVIGVVAAASQLAAACVGILEITKKIKGGSSTLKECQRQLQELHNLCKAISVNPLLQTPEVGAHTSSLLTVINENNLRPLISRGRLWRTWVLLYKDQELSDIFGTIERRKSSLSLVIHNLQAEAIYQIRSNIQIMASPQHSNADSGYDGSELEDHQVPSSSKDASIPSNNSCSPSTSPTTASTTTPSLVRTRSSSEFVSNHGDSLATSDDSASTTCFHDARSASPPRRIFRTDGVCSDTPLHRSKIELVTDEMIEEALKAEERISHKRPGATFYYHCIAHDGSYQRNGNTVIGGKETGPIVSALLAGPVHAHVGCHAEGSGEQLNGTHVVHSGDIDIEVRPVEANARPGNIAVGCTSIGLVKDGQEVRGRQLNGMQIYRAEELEKEELSKD